MTAKNIYIVQLLGGGDNEDAYDNICAFNVLADAEAHVAEMQQEDAIEAGVALEYNIETLRIV
jgi:hypothetical protein